MATIYSDIEYLLSNVEPIVTVEDNERRLNASVTSLSAVEALPIHTSSRMPLATGTQLHYTSGTIKITQGFGVASGKQLTLVAGSVISPISKIMTEATQLSSAFGEVADFYYLRVTADSLTDAFALMQFKDFLQVEAKQLATVENTILTPKDAIRAEASALTLTTASDLHLETFFRNAEAASLASIFAHLHGINSLDASADQLTDVVNPSLLPKSPLSGQADSLSDAFGHFGYGNFLSAVTPTQLTLTSSFITERFPLRASANELNEITLAVITRRKPLKVDAIQLSYQFSHLGPEPFMSTTAKCLTSCSAPKIVTKSRLITRANQVTDVYGLILARTAISSVGATQLTDTASSVIIKHTLDGHAKSLSASSVVLKLKPVLRADVVQLTDVEVDGLAIKSKVASNAKVLTYSFSHLRVKKTVDASVEQLTDTYSFMRCIKYMRNSQITQLTDTTKTLTTISYMASSGDQLSDMYGHARTTPYLLADASELNTASGAILSEGITLSGDIVELSTVLGTILSPTKKLPAVNAEQLSSIFGEIQNNWTGVYATLATQLSAASVLTLAVKSLLRQEVTELTTISRAKITPRVTLDVSLVQLSAATGTVRGLREIGAIASQLTSTATPKLYKYSSAAAEAKQLSETVSTLKIISSRLLAEASQLSRVAATATCTKRLFGSANAVSFVSGHIYHDASLTAEAAQLAFVSGKLQSQMKASATQLSVTYGRIRGSTLGRVYKPSLELYTA